MLKLPLVNYLGKLSVVGCLLLATTAARSTELQRQPVPLPAEMPKLQNLMQTATGDPIDTPREWKRKRQELKAEWNKVLGSFPARKTSLKPEFLEVEDAGKYTRQKLTYQVEDGLRIDAMLLVPKGAKGRLPGIVLFHPTYTNYYRRAAGMEGPSEPERQQAVQLVEHGYVVLTPRCFIYTELPPDMPSKGREVYVSNVKVMQQQHPDWLGMTRMTWDGIRAIDMMETLPNVNPKRIGIFGHSLGAKEVLYVAAFDDRVRCTVFSEGGIGIQFSNWKDVWYLGPGVTKPEFERDHHELMALIAPRPFLLLAGNSADDDRSWAFIEAVMPVYKLLGTPENIAWLNHGLGHRYGAEARTVAEAFLDRHLKGKP